MKQFGLIGYPLSHSFSPSYFHAKFKSLGINARYDLFPLREIQEFIQLIAEHEFTGLNVTIPHKQTIIPLINELSAEAKEIGAVNTIVFHKNKTIGYNTDVFGFEEMLAQTPLKNNSTALIFGNGGAQKAVVYVLNKHSIPYKIIARKPPYDLSFEELDSDIAKTNKLWINTTPIGMFPNEHEALPLPYSHLCPEHLLLDLVYNPEETQYLKHGKKAGSFTLGGLVMLHAQAEQAWKLWNGL